MSTAPPQSARARIESALKDHQRTSRITYAPELAEFLGSHKLAVFFSQIAYWAEKGKRADGLVFKSWKDWRRESQLSERDARECKKRLVALGFLEVEVKRAKAAPTCHYRILIDAFEPAFRAFLELGVPALPESVETDETESVETSQSDCDENAESILTKQQNPDCAETAGSLTENTTKPTDKEVSAKADKPARPRNPLFDALAELCGLTSRLLLEKGSPASRIGKTCSQLQTMGYDLSHVATFKAWWPTFWKGRNGQLPTLQNVIEHIEEAVKAVPSAGIRGRPIVSGVSNHYDKYDLQTGELKPEFSQSERN